jgi:hypothetical protein
MTSFIRLPSDVVINLAHVLGMSPHAGVFSITERGVTDHGVTVEFIDGDKVTYMGDDGRALVAWIERFEPLPTTNESDEQNAEAADEMADRA